MWYAERSVSWQAVSIRPCACDVEVLWSHTLKYVEHNFTVNYPGLNLCRPNWIYSMGNTANTPEFLLDRSGVACGYHRTKHAMSLKRLKTDPSIRGMWSFPWPGDVWGLLHHSKLPTKVFQMASFWNQISMKSIFRPASALDPGLRWKSLRQWRQWSFL